ncbi:hypothetical protein THAOC_18908, partial [Thalassiosira oceanica]
AFSETGTLWTMEPSNGSLASAGAFFVLLKNDGLGKKTHSVLEAVSLPFTVLPICVYVFLQYVKADENRHEGMDEGGESSKDGISAAAAGHLSPGRARMAVTTMPTTRRPPTLVPWSNRARPVDPSTEKGRPEIRVPLYFLRVYRLEPKAVNMRDHCGPANAQNSY